MSLEPGTRRRTRRASRLRAGAGATGRPWDAPRAPTRSWAINKSRAKPPNSPSHASIKHQGRFLTDPLPLTLQFTHSHSKSPAHSLTYTLAHSPPPRPSRPAVVGCVRVFHVPCGDLLGEWGGELHQLRLGDLPGSNLFISLSPIGTLNSRTTGYDLLNSPHPPFCLMHFLFLSINFRISQPSPGASGCVVCGPGTSLPTTGGAASSDCGGCAVGTFAAVSGAASCESCAAGTYQVSTPFLLPR